MQETDVLTGKAERPTAAGELTNVLVTENAAAIDASSSFMAVALMQ